MNTSDVPLGYLTLENFDKLKNWQRALESSEGRSLTNVQALNRIVATVPDEPEVVPAALGARGNWSSAELREILEGPLGSIERPFYADLLAKAERRERRAPRKPRTPEQRDRDRRSDLIRRAASRLDALEARLVSAHADRSGHSRWRNRSLPLFEREWAQLNKDIGSLERRITEQGCIPSADFHLARAEQMARIEYLRNKELPERAADYVPELPPEYHRQHAERTATNDASREGRAYALYLSELESKHAD